MSPIDYKRVSTEDEVENIRICCCYYPCIPEHKRKELMINISIGLSLFLFVAVVIISLIFGIWMFAGTGNELDEKSHHRPPNLSELNALITIYFPLTIVVEVLLLILCWMLLTSNCEKMKNIQRVTNEK